MKAPDVPVYDPHARCAAQKPTKLDALLEKEKHRAARVVNGAIFRKAVWTRDKGLCQLCGIVVKRTLEPLPNQGHVHHRRGRNAAPAARYDPAQAVLVCLRCHAKIHAGEIKL